MPNERGKKGGDPGLGMMAQPGASGVGVSSVHLEEKKIGLGNPEGEDC